MHLKITVSWINVKVCSTRTANSLSSRVRRRNNNKSTIVRFSPDVKRRQRSEITPRSLNATGIRAKRDARIACTVFNAVYHAWFLASMNTSFFHGDWIVHDNIIKERSKDIKDDLRKHDICRCSIIHLDDSIRQLVNVYHLYQVKYNKAQIENIIKGEIKKILFYNNDS